MASGSPTWFQSCVCLFLMGGPWSSRSASLNPHFLARKEGVTMRTGGYVHVPYGTCFLEVLRNQ